MQKHKNQSIFESIDQVGGGLRGADSIKSVVEPQSPIHGKLEELSYAIGFASSSVSVLREKLQPVLSPAQIGAVEASGVARNPIQSEPSEVEQLLQIMILAVGRLNAEMAAIRNDLRI